jgi:PhzF family phenazine biosynthesis protein
MKMPDCFHVDVFASGQLTGNGLAVFMDADGWTARTMLQLTMEMRQFESIFLSEITSTGARARIFTMDEELPFAGHPALGAAAVLHRIRNADVASCSWVLQLACGDVPVRTSMRNNHHHAEMEQNVSHVGEELGSKQLQPILASLGLDCRHIACNLGARVISTGLPYLVIPVRPEGLQRAAISGGDFERLLSVHGAKFVLLLDIESREVRTWDNLGRVEDVATGSAAGPAATFLYEFALADPKQPIELAQGRFAGRPSRLSITRVSSTGLLVSGEVWPVGHGFLDPNVLNVLEVRNSPLSSKQTA